MDEIDIRTRMAGNQHLVDEYKKLIEPYYKKKREEILADIRESYSYKGENKEKAVYHAVGRLNALEELNEFFTNKEALVKKDMKKLEEKENGERERQREDIFHKYHGG